MLTVAVDWLLTPINGDHAAQIIAVAIGAGLWASLLQSHLSQPTMIFSWWFRMWDWAPEWIRKPAGACSVCHSVWVAWALSAINGNAGVVFYFLTAAGAMGIAVLMDKTQHIE